LTETGQQQKSNRRVAMSPQARSKIPNSLKSLAIRKRSTSVTLSAMVMSTKVTSNRRGNSDFISA
jgi:hypothetical protein